MSQDIMPWQTKITFIKKLALYLSKEHTRMLVAQYALKGPTHANHDHTFQSHAEHTENSHQPVRHSLRRLKKRVLRTRPPLVNSDESSLSAHNASHTLPAKIRMCRRLRSHHAKMDEFIPDNMLRLRLVTFITSISPLNCPQHPIDLKAEDSWQSPIEVAIFLEVIISTNVSSRWTFQFMLRSSWHPEDNNIEIRVSFGLVAKYAKATYQRYFLARLLH